EFPIGGLHARRWPGRQNREILHEMLTRRYPIGLVAAWTAACETSGDHSETPLLVTTDQNLIQFRIL
ncbi:hypothetical protein, partial [Brevundimonas sp.]|uniref:hypothetical protein n=1 Tax=Brevundimonas sp. TaxID=1871086 RepID=UPI002FC62641